MYVHKSSNYVQLKAKSTHCGLFQWSGETTSLLGDTRVVRGCRDCNNHYIQGMETSNFVWML